MLNVELEGKNISYKGVEAEITAVTSVGVELVFGEFSEILNEKDFNEYLKSDDIIFL